jgi:HEAT repeat protein
MRHLRALKELLIAPILVLALALSGTSVPASGGQSVEDQLKRLESADKQVRDAAVIVLAKFGPGELDTIFISATFFLGPRFKRLADERKTFKDDPVLERILADIARALAAMGPAAAEELAKRGTSGELTMESDLSLQALKTMGPQARKAIPILKTAFASENHYIQWSGMLGLAAVDGPDYPTLRAALRSPNPDIRALAVLGFGKTGSPAAVDTVLATFRDPDPVVKDTAITAMRDLGPLLVPKIPEILADEDMVSRVPFDMMGAAAVSPLKDLLLKGQRQICDRAGVALALAGGTALAALTAALGHPNPAVRLAVVSALRQVDRNDKFIAESLAKVWKDNDSAVRDAALTSLPYGGDEDRSLVPIFMAGLKDPSAPERIRSAMALAILRQSARDSAGVLMAAMADSDGGVRSAAAQALGLVGPDPGLAVPKLVLLAQDPDAVVRQGAVFALGNMKAIPEAQKAVLQAVEDPDPRVASEAVMSLWGFESASAAAKPILLRSLKSRLKEIKLAALDVLRKWNKAFPEEAKPILETLRAQDPDQEIKDAADGILQRFAPASDNPALAGPPPPPLPPVPPPPPMFRR